MLVFGSNSILLGAKFDFKLTWLWESGLDLFFRIFDARASPDSARKSEQNLLNMSKISGLLSSTSLLVVVVGVLFAVALNAKSLDDLESDQGIDEMDFEPSFVHPPITDNRHGEFEFFIENPVRFEQETEDSLASDHQEAFARFDQFAGQPRDQLETPMSSSFPFDELGDNIFGGQGENSDNVDAEILAELKLEEGYGPRYHENEISLDIDPEMMDLNEMDDVSLHQRPDFVVDILSPHDLPRPSKPDLSIAPDSNRHLFTKLTTRYSAPSTKPTTKATTKPQTTTRSSTSTLTKQPTTSSGYERSTSSRETRMSSGTSQPQLVNSTKANQTIVQKVRVTTKLISRPSQEKTTLSTQSTQTITRSNDQSSSGQPSSKMARSRETSTQNRREKAPTDSNEPKQQQAGSPLSLFELDSFPDDTLINSPSLFSKSLTKGSLDDLDELEETEFFKEDKPVSWKRRGKSNGARKLDSKEQGR